MRIIKANNSSSAWINASKTILEEGTNRSGLIEILNLVIEIEHNKTLITPYKTEQVKDYFYQFDYFQLNKPKQKNHIRESFDKEFSLVGRIRNHQPLQGKVSLVSKLFQTLLENKEINFNRRSDIKWVCWDWKNRCPSTKH